LIWNTDFGGATKNFKVALEITQNKQTLFGLPKTIYFTLTYNQII
jgi:hypothetical protein